MHGNSKYPLELKFAVCCGEELKHFYGRLVNPAQIPSGIYIQWYSDGSYEKVWVDE